MVMLLVSTNYRLQGTADLELLETTKKLICTKIRLGIYLQQVIQAEKLVGLYPPLTHTGIT